MTLIHSRAVRSFLAAAVLASLPALALAQWDGYAENAQHTALAPSESQPLTGIKWSTPVDTSPPTSGYLLIHYGSPMITSADTVIVPVKDTLNQNSTGQPFYLEALNGTTGAVLWKQTTDYTLPPASSPPWPTYEWTPSYGATITTGGKMYYPGAGGTVYARNNLDSSGPATVTQYAFFGMNNYTANAAAFNANVAITTPITADSAGNIYFGYSTSNAVLPGINGGQPLGNGLARISADGVGTFFQAQDLQAGGSSAGMVQVATNSAPAISNDGSTVYALLSAGNPGQGRLVAFNSTTLAPINSALLLDPSNNPTTYVRNISSASPMVGPDGDVYIGTLTNDSRGYLQHYSADLTVKKPTGGFGWDVTPSVVPASMVPSYHGTSAYLLMDKYNSYADEANKIAILDPNDTQIDPRSGQAIMKEVLTILGPTEDGGGYKEWCINTAVVDPATDSVLVNSEDGRMYRWDLTTNTLSQSITLTPGLLEAYTPTLMAPDGTVFAINDAQLFAIGVPSVAVAWDAGGSGAAAWSNAARWSGAVTPNNGTPVTAWYDVSISGAVTLDVDAAVHSLTMTGASLTGNHNVSFSNAIIDGGYRVSGITTITGVAAFGGQDSTGPITGTGTLIVNTGASVDSAAITLRNVNVAGNYQVRENSAASKIVALTIAGATDNWTGQLDVTNNALVIQPEGSVKKAAALLTLQNQIVSGSQNHWSGNGITSSTAAADPAHYAVGLFDNALLNLASFGGAVGNADSNSILVGLSLIGDANSDGVVNGADLSIIANDWNLHGATNWAQGDLNLDGTVDSLDVNLVVSHWDVLSGFAPLVNYTPAFSFTLVPVPEAGSLFMLAAGGVTLLRRRPWNGARI